MSSLAISSSASTTLPPVDFHGHGHGHGHKGLQLDALSPTSGSSAAQIPVGASQGLFANLLQSLQQAIGVQSTAAVSATGATATSAASSTTATSPAAGAASASTTAVPTVAQDLHGFLHSLFQVLKQDGLGGGGTTAAAASTGTNGAPAVTGAGNYQGSLVSSLQTLIQQVGSNGSTSPAIANLNSSFNNLLQGLGVNGSAATAAAGGTTSAQTSNASLQNFLNNLLQNLQANGLQGPKLTGSNVNANV